jgi:outer membrane immunogenic protein
MAGAAVDDPNPSLGQPHIGGISLDSGKTATPLGGATWYNHSNKSDAFQGAVMRKAALGVIAIAALIGTPALAADMEFKAPPPAPACIWCGWYVGLNGGVGEWANSNGVLSGTDTGVGGILEPFGVPLTFSSITIPLSAGGVLGGVEVGYNWQTGNWVVGLEADADGAWIRGNDTIIAGGGVGFVPGDAKVTVTGTDTLQGLETFRGRFGWVASPQFLIFATGGLALGQDSLTLQAVCPTCNPTLPSAGQTGTNTNSTTRAGYAAGGGFEWMIAPHWSLKLEYLFVDLGSQSSTFTYTYPTAQTSTATLTVRDRYNIARAGINWHF